MRETIGYTAKKYAIKRDDSTIVLKIIPREAAASNLQVLIQGEGMGEYVYQKRQGGNLLKFYEYKIIPDKKSRKFGPTEIPEVAPPPSKKQTLMSGYCKGISSTGGRSI